MYTINLLKNKTQQCRYSLKNASLSDFCNCAKIIKCTILCCITFQSMMNFIYSGYNAIIVHVVNYWLKSCYTVHVRIQSFHELHSYGTKMVNGPKKKGKSNFVQENITHTCTIILYTPMSHHFSLLSFKWKYEVHR